MKKTMKTYSMIDMVLESLNIRANAHQDKTYEHGVSEALSWVLEGTDDVEFPIAFDCDEYLDKDFRDTTDAALVSATWLLLRNLHEEAGILLKTDDFMKIKDSLAKAIEEYTDKA